MLIFLYVNSERENSLSYGINVWEIETVVIDKIQFYPCHWFDLLSA